MSTRVVAGRACSFRMRRAPSRATVLCWVARMLSHEADAIDYAWPPPSDEQRALAAELHAGADAFHALAVRGHTRPRQLWKRAHAAWLCHDTQIGEQSLR